MFLAGANSIFTGDKLLTTPNPNFDVDSQLFDTLGLKAKKAFTNPLKPLEQQQPALDQGSESVEQRTAAAVSGSVPSPSGPHEQRRAHL